MRWKDFKEAVEERGVTDEIIVRELLLNWRDDEPNDAYSFAIDIKDNLVKMWNT